MSSIKEQENVYRLYINEHIDNIKRAWNIMKVKCKDILIAENIDIEQLEENVENHDLSKFTDEEFNAYRRHFYPSEEDKEVDKDEFNKAWVHHYTNNPHHWDYWVGKIQDMTPIYVAEMTLDWIAMGMKFNNSALDYYNKNKNAISISKKTETLFFKLINKYYN